MSGVQFRLCEILTRGSQNERVLSMLPERIQSGIE